MDAQFVILIHPREVKKKNGTGRMLHLCIKDSLLKEGIDFSKDDEINDLIADPGNFCCVLYPGKASKVLNGLPERDIKELFPNKRPVIFMIDASWSLARKIMKLSGNLNSLPRFALKPEKRSRYRIRVQPDKQCLSSIEAARDLIDILEASRVIKVLPHGAQSIMMDLFDDMVEDQIGHAMSSEGYRNTMPHLGGKPPAKKWEKRSLFYNK